jgi:hypothetical protein
MASSRLGHVVGITSTIENLIPIILKIPKASISLGKTIEIALPEEQSNDITYLPYTKDIMDVLGKNLKEASPC